MNTIARIAKGMTLLGAVLIGILGLVLFFIMLSNANEGDLPTASADGEWSVYLLNQDPVELVQVSHDGTVRAFDLGVRDIGTFGGQIAVAADGSEAAYCQTAVANDGAVDAYPVVKLIIRDFETNSTRVETEIGSSDGCRINSQSYSADHALLAVGLINPSTTPEDTFWRLLIIDTSTGQIVHELNSESAIAVANGQSVGLSNYFMPEPRLVSDNEIIFTQIAWRSDGLPVGDGVRWNWVDNTLTRAANWGNHTVDSIMETGELVWAGYDIARPAADPGGPIPQSNVVYVKDASGTVIPVFYTEDYVIIDTLFINNGQEIAVFMLEGFDPENPPQGNQPTQWVAVDRAGNVRTLHADLLNFSQMTGAPDGYALLTMVNPTDGSVNPTSTLTRYHNGDESTLWTTDHGYWMAVGQSSVTAADGMAAFVPAN
jgi:hypothetical protein